MPRPKRVLEQIKGISEQKAAKILAEGEFTIDLCNAVRRLLTRLFVKRRS